MNLAKYNQSKTITFDLVAPDGVDLIINATFAAGDIKIMKDEGVEANTTNLPTDEGTGYSLVLTATEMSAARIRLYIIDQTATKIWLDMSIGVETYGNASAEHAFDLDTASVAQTVDNDVLAQTTNTVVDGIQTDLSNATDGLGALKALIDTVNTDLSNGTDGLGALKTLIDALNDPTVAAIADAIWDEELTVGHTAADSAGAKLNAAGGAADPWATSLPGAYGSGTAGEILGDWLDGNRLDLILDIVAADTTTEIPATLADIQAQVGNIATGSAAVSTVAESQTLTTGTEVNTYAVTDTVDGIEHEITDAAGAMDISYQFDVGADGVGSEVSMWGRLTGGNDIIGVYAWDYVGLAWDQVGTMVGSGGTTNAFISFNLLNRHTGTGADLGKVRVRGYAASGLTTATLYLDQAYVSYAVIPASRTTKGSISDVTPAVDGFDTDLTQANNLWVDALIIFTSGVLDGESRTIGTYVNANGAITVDEDFSQVPADGDNFIIYHTHIHPVTQIQAGLATEAKQDIIDANVDLALADTSELQTNQGNWATAVGFATEAKQDAQGAIITEARLAELDAANIPADIGTLLSRIIGTLAAGTHNPASAAQIAVLTDWINGGRLDLLLDAIKAKTDPLAFTKANEVDSNIQSINGVTITGDGSASPFDV